MKVLLLGFFFASCAHIYSPNELTIGDKKYLNKVAKMKPSFRVSNERSHTVWKRGVDFIKNYSFLEIESATRNFVATKDPNAIEVAKPGYVLTRIEKNGKTLFKVRCMYPSLHYKYTKDLCKANEQYMTYYMRTGKLKDKFINRVSRDKLRKQTKGTPL